MKTGLSFTNYSHRQNRLDLGITNLIYEKLKYFLSDSASGGKKIQTPKLHHSSSVLLSYNLTPSLPTSPPTPGAVQGDGEGGAAASPHQPLSATFARWDELIGTNAPFWSSFLLKSWHCRVLKSSQWMSLNIVLLDPILILLSPPSKLYTFPNRCLSFMWKWQPDLHHQAVSLAHPSGHSPAGLADETAAPL